MNSILIVRDTDFSWRAREVLREVEDLPHQLLRLDVVGPYFPDRDTVPVVRLVSGRQRVEALMTEIATDHTHMRAYFPVDQPISGRIEFGYGSEVLGSLVVREPRVERLEPGRIEPPFHRVALADLGAFGKQRR